MHRLTTSLFVFTILAISSCTTIFAADFTPVFKNSILPHEGGYTKDRNDPGNWTGGKVGRGKLLGTKYGIAANTYGVELAKQGRTIKGLTVAEAETIYKRDYWDAYRLGDLKSQGIADEICDEIVNMGPGGGHSLLSKVFAEIEWAQGIKIPARPAFEPATIAWINEYTASKPNRIAFYNSIRMKRVKFYDNLVKRKPHMRQYFYSWIDRSVD